MGEKNGREIILQVIYGLQFMHNKEYGHRDIKLENILIFGNRYQICDFDRTMKAIDANREPIATKDRRGTYEYMAPELLSGEGSLELR